MCNEEFAFEFDGEMIHKDSGCCGVVHGNLTLDGVESLATQPNHELCKRCINTETLRALYRMIA